MAARNRKGTQNMQIHKDGPPSKGVKRQQEKSPQVPVAKKTRTAFGDITNKENAKVAGKTKKGTQQRKAVKAVLKKKTVAVPKQPKAVKNEEPVSSKKEDNISWEIIELSQDSISSQGTSGSSSQGLSSSQSSPKSEVSILNEKNSQMSQKTPVSQDWVDIDAENINDPLHCPAYAYHIFEYYKSREEKFRLTDYLAWNKDISSSMRAILVDWLVEVQENFELNHETLYLAVKLVDHYLAAKLIGKDKLQLVGATAMFIASKFDERLPPVLDDFLYICDDAYTKSELLAMERNILKTIDFDLGIPLSYRYLRRYAKCARVCMVTLTLGRYILELSLMDYHFSRMSDSELASAALLLAMKMKGNGEWDSTLVHYTGRKESELTETVKSLNSMVGGEGSKQLATIRTKYSHKVFHEVAKIPTVDCLQL